MNPLVKSTRRILSHNGQQRQEKRSCGLRLSRFIEHCSSEDEQELSQDEIRTLGMAGSGVSSIDATEPLPCRPKAIHSSSARALYSEQAKRRRAQRSCPAALALLDRTLLESIDESLEDWTSVATMQTCHQLSMQVTCLYCGEVFSRQLDLDHHIGASHIGPRPDVPRVVHADYGPSEDVDELVCLTGGNSPGDFFLPPTLGHSAQNDGLVVEGWRAAALRAVQDGFDGNVTASKPYLKPSVFTAKLEEHHGPRLGPQTSAPEVRPEGGPASYPTVFCGENGSIHGQDLVEQEGKKEAEEERGHDENGHSNKNDADDADDDDIYGLQGEYLSSAPAGQGETEKKIALPRVLPRVLPSLMCSSASPRHSWANQRLPSIDSVISNTANFRLETPSRLKRAVVRQPLFDDDESSLS
ncbi:hypothetical protein E4U43_004152 [Claviceps pusilla]|uniref:C2H2-type domain-containing protein n=1 Tax=Claviceps pusilla TaxID=123648 RepID=A0A9P7N497_9HYPO|nr:hypothetical protein E4U43_004152 [Claviceps pusilla]